MKKDILSTLPRILAVSSIHVFCSDSIFTASETFLMLFSIPFLMVPNALITICIIFALIIVIFTIIRW